MGVIRTMGLVATVLAVATSAGVVSTAAASEGRTVTIRSDLNGVNDTVTDTSLCQAAGGEYAVRPTDVSYSGTSTYTGTFSGRGRYCGYITDVHPDGALGFTETDTFSGTVKGCGRGTVSYRVHGVIYPTHVDAAHAGLGGGEDWKIVSRSGTRGLSGLIAGGGHDVARLGLDNTVYADFRGSVRCL